MNAQELLESRDCRFPSCTNDASDSPRRGRHANLCKDHRGAKVSTPAEVKVKVDAFASVSLTKRVQALVPTAKKLEGSVARRRSATAEAKAALAEFNDGLNAVREAAQAILGA